METNIPSLEEVKEYFKNAKEVRSLYDNTIYLFRGVVEGSAENTFMNLFPNNTLWNKTKGYAEIISYKEEIETPKHYDNSKGTLYKVATERGWNPYLFDIIKRLERAEKKGEFKTDLEKSINVIKLWLQEYEVKK